MLDSEGLVDTRLRISSIEPRSLKKDFIDLLAQSDGRICRHLHLPLQSGSSRVLREMNRPYNANDYVALVDSLKERVGDLSLTTDVIVGFPGETDQDLNKHATFHVKSDFQKFTFSVIRSVQVLLQHCELIKLIPT